MIRYIIFIKKVTLYVKEYIIAFLLLGYDTLYSHPNPWSLSCAQIEIHHGSLTESARVTTSAHMMVLTPILMTGIFFDYRMITFLKKRNQSSNGPGQAKLVPWKSDHQEEDYNVPIATSIVGIAILILCTSAATLALVFVESLDDWWRVPMIGCYMATSFQVPIFLALTIRVARVKKSMVQVPKGLQFHGDVGAEVEEDGNHAYGKLIIYM